MGGEGWGGGRVEPGRGLRVAGGGGDRYFYFRFAYPDLHFYFRFAYPDLHLYFSIHSPNTPSIRRMPLPTTKAIGRGIR